MKYNKYNRDRKRQILSVIIGDKTNAGCFQKEADQYMKEDTLATPPADDKEYREFVSHVIKQYENLIHSTQQAIDEPSENVSMISLWQTSIANYTRLIADIKKGVGL